MAVLMDKQLVFLKAEHQAVQMVWQKVDQMVVSSVDSMVDKMASEMVVGWAACWAVQLVDHLVTAKVEKLAFLLVVVMADYQDYESVDAKVEQWAANQVLDLAYLKVAQRVQMMGEQMDTETVDQMADNQVAELVVNEVDGKDN